MEFVFESAEQGLMWSAEFLRRRRWPKLAALWREVAGEADFVENVWKDSRLLELPGEYEDRLSLALKVADALAEVERLAPGTGHALHLWAWGDWADEARLRAALAIQEKCRREGLRVRLGYRYTYAQLAAQLDCDRKAAWRRVQDGLTLLSEAMARRGVLAAPTAPDSRGEDFKNVIDRDDFKGCL